MTTETLLVKTKDNNVIVFNIDYANEVEQRRIKVLCQNACKDKTYDELSRTGVNVSGAVVDAKNTEFLREEISGYHFHKEPHQYRNDLSSANMPPCPPNTIQFDYTIPDDSVPEMFKSIGGKITIRDRTYDVYFDGEEYVVRGFDKTVAQFSPEEKRIDVIRNQFRFEPEAYAELQRMISDFEAKSPKPDIADYLTGISDSKNKSLFKIYADEYKRVQHHEKTVSHEIKHLKNKVFYDGLSLKSDAKRLSVEDCYRISVEDERSAYLDQLVNGINKYLKGGNFNDYSMFDEFSRDFADKLKNKASDAERLAFATNMSVIVAEAVKKFNTKHKESYDKREFAALTKAIAEEQPVTAPEDTDRKWFKKIRSLYYNFEIYNPQTGRMEHRNLAQYITPALEVSARNYEVEQEGTEEKKVIDIESTILAPAAQAMKDKNDRISGNVANNTINPSLVAPARALMRDSLNQSTFLNTVDNFRITSLYDNTWNPDAPQPAEIPNDHADWSDDLQRYWKRVEGYREIAKNNIEYKFAVNDATISYKNRHEAEISENADYDLYVKMLAEPTNKTRKVEFLDTLSKEQALTLYVACINSGRIPTGNVPTDLSQIDSLTSIPEAAREAFKQRMRQPQSQQQTGRSQRQTQRYSAQQLLSMRQYSGR